MLRIANYAVSRNEYCISTKTEVRNGRCQSLKALLFLSRERTLILYSLADEDTVLTSFPPFFYMWWGKVLNIDRASKTTLDKYTDMMQMQYLIF